MTDKTSWQDIGRELKAIGKEIKEKNKEKIKFSEKKEKEIGGEINEFISKIIRKIDSLIKTYNSENTSVFEATYEKIKKQISTKIEFFTTIIKGHNITIEGVEDLNSLKEELVRCLDLRKSDIETKLQKK